ncbi:MAG: Clp protease N-terminal domain-containing protein [Candidatus Xenobiia bacterium LiM19]
MAEGSGQCFFCGKPERKGIRLLRYETRAVCEECLAELKATSPFSFSDHVLKAGKEPSTDAPVTWPPDLSPDNSRKSPGETPVLSSSDYTVPPSSRESADACDISGALGSQLTFNKESRIVLAEAKKSLGRTYETIAFEVVKAYFPRRPVTVRAAIYEEGMTLRRSIEISVQGSFISDELEAAEFMLRRNLGLAEGDTISVVSTGPPEIFDAVLPSGRRWVFMLADMKREEAEKLLQWNVYGTSRKRDADTEKERIPAEIAEAVGDALRRHLDSYSNPAVLCRFALVTAMSGYYERCRHTLSRIPAESPYSPEAANILAMIEAEDRAGKGVSESIRVLKSELLAHNIRRIIGEVLRFNLALLLEETGEPGSAEELYRRIFERDWHFLDVRERLGRLSPEGIASAGCAKNLRIIRRALSHWHRSLGSFPESLEELAPAWISSVPVCPASGIAYDYQKTAYSFRVWCSRCQYAEGGTEAEQYAEGGAEVELTSEGSAEAEQTGKGCTGTGQSFEAGKSGHIDSSASDSGADNPCTERPVIDSDVSDHSKREIQDGPCIAADEAPEHDSSDSTGESVELSMDESTVKAIAAACAEAGKMKMSRVGTEHLLLGILRTATGRVARILKKSGVMISKIRREIRKKTGKDYEYGSSEPVFSRFSLDAIEEAFSIVRAGAGGKVEIAHLLLGVIAMQPGLACESISNSGVDIGELEWEIAKLLKEMESRNVKSSPPTGSEAAEDADDGNAGAVEVGQQLKAADGWKMVKACRTEYQAIFEKDYVLKISETDFICRLDLRSRTFSSSQITYDSKTGRVFYISIPIYEVMRGGQDRAGIFSPHVCDRKVLNAEAALGGRQLSDDEKEDYMPHALQTVRPAIYSVSIHDGRTERIAQALPGYDFKGMLALSPGGSSLITSMKQSGRKSGKREDPRIAFITVSTGKLTSVPFETSEVYPEDIRFGPENQILSLVPPGELRIFNFSGSMKYYFTADGFVQGASFHPRQNRVAVGMQGICIWDLDSDDFRQITPYGSFPVWSPDGDHIWFRRDDSTLCTVEVHSEKVKAICMVKGVRSPGLLLSSKPVFSPCGRYLFCALSASSDEAAETEGCRATGEETGGGFERDFFCIVDTVKKQIWSAPGRSQSFLWV